MRTRWLPLLVSVLLIPVIPALPVLAPGPSIGTAHAQGEPSPKDRKRARTLLTKAGDHKKIGDRFQRRKRPVKARASYRDAAVAYRDAYRITQDAAILVELGAVYQARGELLYAARVYRKYLEREPQGEAADATRSQLDELESQLAETKMAGTEPEPGDPALDPTDIIGPEPEPEPLPELAPEEPEPETAAPEPLPVPVPESPAAGSRSWVKWSGVGAGATGAALVGLGVYFGLDARTKADTLSNKTEPWTPADRDLIASGESAETKMYIFTAVGGAMIIGGAVLFYLGMNEERPAGEGAAALGSGDPWQRAAIVPQVGRDSASITLSGHF